MKRPLFIVGICLVCAIAESTNVYAYSEDAKNRDPAGLESWLTVHDQAADQFSMWDDSLIVAYYGRPDSVYMGIVGRHSKKDIIELVKKKAMDYQAIAGDRKVKPALYLIYGTCQPQGKIGYMSDKMTHDYINAALEQGVMVILDHQIGVYTLQKALDRLLPYLIYPNVHIALDFEWRTGQPMKEIGSVQGDELNWIQEYVGDYLIAKEIKEKKYIVFHQFTKAMVRNPGVILTISPQVELIHCTSGWGTPANKTATHSMNSYITGIPRKGFKLWYFFENKPGIHFDNPLMMPDEVLSLSPEPFLVVYQ